MATRPLEAEAEHFAEHFDVIEREEYPAKLWLFDTSECTDARLSSRLDWLEHDPEKWKPVFGKIMLK